MSLRVWLPLTKDLRNQGLDNVTVTNNGATFDSAGKLGGCYSFDGTDDRIAIVGLSLPNIWSYGCWFYSATSTRGWEGVITLNSSSGDVDNQLGFYTYPASSRIQNTANGQWNSAITYTTGQWNHFFGTFDGSNLKTYINGILVNTKAITNSLLSRSNLTIGGRSSSAAGGNTSITLPFQGKINDVRIYDHCLSPMEVKELSKGLVLHYPLNRQGWGQENLFTQGYWSYSSDQWIHAVANNSEAVRPITNADGSCTLTGPGTGSNQQCFLANSKTSQMINLTAGETYTISVKITASGPGKFRYYWYDYDSSGTNIGFHNQETIFSGGETKVISYTRTLPDGTAKCYWELNMLASATTSTILLHAHSLKLEKGSTATPWCPNSSDILATTMGLNGTTEYDCSGFGNNGTRTGTFDWTSDTPKYKVSQVFNGTDNAIQTPNLTTMITDKNYTVACWTYKTVIGTKNYQTIYGGPSGFELEARSSSSTSPLYRIHNWGGGTTAYNFGEWTHFCFVHTDSDSKLYVNGELKITGTSANVPSGNYFVGAWNTSTSQNYEGNMSDFRIYATALSADDVKSLYQNSAYIDSSGNVYGAVHSEV